MWEELSAHAEEFKGHKLRLIVLPKDAEASAPLADDAALRDIAERLFLEADNIERTPGRSNNNPHEVAFDEIVVDRTDPLVNTETYRSEDHLTLAQGKMRL